MADKTALKLKADRNLFMDRLMKDINQVQGFASKGETQEVINGVEKLKKSFREFEEKHEFDHGTIDEHDFDDIDESDNHFFDITDR